MSGGARKAINERRAQQAVAGNQEGVCFARVSRILGANHVEVSIPSSKGIKTLRARIPNLLARRGATPITTKDVVTIFVGKYFENDSEISPSMHFDVTAVLTDKQSHSLYESGEIPAWMVHDDGAEAKNEDLIGGFEWDYSDDKDGADEAPAAGAKKKTKGPAVVPIQEESDDGEIDVDAI